MWQVSPTQVQAERFSLATTFRSGLPQPCWQQCKLRTGACGNSNPRPRIWAGPGKSRPRRAALRSGFARSSPHLRAGLLYLPGKRPKTYVYFSLEFYRRALPIRRTVSGGLLFPDRNPDRRSLPLAAGSIEFRNPLPLDTPVKPTYRASAERNAQFK